MAIKSKNKLGKSAAIILGSLRGESCTKEKVESPDFILKGTSGVIGIEHFQVTATSYMRKGKWQSTPDEIYHTLCNNKGKHYDRETIENTYKKGMKENRYSSSIQVFKSSFENHLKKAKEYKKNICKYGGDHLVFLIDVLYWDFYGLTAVGNKTFNCDYVNIPLCKDIVDIISDANNIDTVVIMFRFDSTHDSTVFAFTPQEAKNDDIGVEVYEYIGYGESLESELIKLSCNGVTADKTYNIDNYFKLLTTVEKNKKEIKDCILAGKSCIVPTSVYDEMAYKGLIDDKR
jgi:hypothetical protein